MSELSNNPGTPASGDVRRDAEAQLVTKARKDENFRRRLIQDPKKVINEELAIQLPDNFEVKVVEETSRTFYIVLPPPAGDLQEGEISDMELESIAAGCDKQRCPRCMGGTTQAAPAE